MNAPDKIFVGITNGKDYSIVGEGYLYAKEYVSKGAVMDLLRSLAVVYRDFAETTCDRFFDGKVSACQEIEDKLKKI